MKAFYDLVYETVHLYICICIDRDVRKCIGIISNYKRLEDHLNHSSLKDIKEATASHIINWSLTSKWFNFNNHEAATKTNDHIWSYPLLANDIRAGFKHLGNSLIAILTKNADKLSLCISDSVKYSKTFRWAYIHPSAVLLLRSYVTNDLYHIFRMHINKIKHIERLLLPFLHENSSYFKINIWKKRSKNWKNGKKIIVLLKIILKPTLKILDVIAPRQYLPLQEIGEAVDLINTLYTNSTY
uniref:Uncharacterized protein n=1 Tax=Rhizophagus irregularis (strain DAOM 181602 / DAOM 197198 / MUCL 43194) TaxID=747089 RepID=U9UUL7_RHIID